MRTCTIIVTFLAMVLLIACESDQSTATTNIAAGAVSDTIVCPEGVRCDECCEIGCEMTCEETDDGRCLVTCFIEGEKCCSTIVDPRDCEIPFGARQNGCAACPEGG